MPTPSKSRTTTKPTPLVQRRLPTHRPPTHPGEMLLEGTIRTFNDADLDTIERRMREIFDGITRSAGATGYSSINDASCVR